jgi:ABC-type antimicrobial peptide transport system permease subunit
LKLYVGEAILVALTGGAMGCLLALILVSAMSHAPGMSLFLSGMKVTVSTLLVAIIVAGMVGFLSAILPAHHAAKLDIVEGLRYIG